MSRRLTSWGTQLLPPVLLAGFVFWLLTVHGDNRKWMSATVTALITAAAASGVNLLVGYTGLLSLGHATFLVIGGFAGGVWAVEMGLDPWLGFPFAFVVGAAVGVVLALVSCHLRGFYLTVVTLAFGLLMPAVMVIFDSAFGGRQGRRVPEPLDVRSLPLADDSRQRGLVVIAAVILFVVLFVARNLVHSRWGRAWTAIRDSETAARASGVNAYWYKVASFGLSSGLVAMVGVVAANQFRLASNELGPQQLSFRLVVICVLGGLGTLAGPVIAAFAISYVLATAWVQETFGDYLGIFFGALAILGIVGNPGGQVEALRRVLRRARPAPLPTASREEAEESPPGRASAASGPVLELTGLTKRFGGVTAVDDIDLCIQAGTVHGLIGPNGSGKTTIINLISGFYRASGGSVRLLGESIERMRTDKRTRRGLARTFQNIQIWRGMTVLANVEVGGHHRTRAGLLRSMLALGFTEERASRKRAWALLRLVGLEDRAHDLAGTLPFADQRRLEIARALASDPVLLLLDEPGAGLHPAEQHDLERLIRAIRARGVTVLLIEHHMELVMSLCDTVTVIDYGRKIAEGPPAQVQSDPTVIQAYLGESTGAAPVRVREASTTGHPLLRVEDLEVNYGAASALRGVSFDVYEGEVVAIIGGNGAGKTTTLKTISGLAESYKSVSGSITFEGRSIERKPAHAIAEAGIVHVPEGRRVFPAMTVEENLILGGYRRRRDVDLTQAVHEVFERFEALDRRRHQPAGLLSGGEQQMLAMGRALMADPRLLLLDEPSLGLAPKIVENIFEIIEQLARDGTTIVLVEQLATQALAVADRAYVLESGRVTLGGPSDDLRRDPAVVQAYLGG